MDPPGDRYMKFMKYLQSNTTTPCVLIYHIGIIRSIDETQAVVMIDNLDRIPRKETLSEQVYKQVRDALIEGRFPPGQKLAIRGLAEAVGTSPTPVRDALFRLAAEQAVELGSHRSVRVAVLSSERLAEINQLREVLEGMAVEYAALRCTDTAALRLNARYNGQSAEPNDRKRQSRVVTQFQFLVAVYELAEMPVLAWMINSLWACVGPYLNLAIEEDHEEQLPDFPYRDLIDALRIRDGSAAREIVETRIRKEGARMLRVCDGDKRRPIRFTELLTS